MKNFKSIIIPSLIFAGIVPFILALILKLNIFILPIIGEDKLILGYSIIISAFIAGSHWGISLKSSSSFTIISSNLLALIILFLFLWHQHIASIAIFGFVLTFQLGIDAILLKQQLITKSYWHYRCLATLVVISIITMYSLAS